MRHPALLGGSSSGRTTDSDSVYLGSNPSPPANNRGPAARGLVFCCTARVLLQRVSRVRPTRSRVGRVLVVGTGRCEPRKGCPLQVQRDVFAAGGHLLKERDMPRGDKSRYTAKQKRK